MPTNISQFTPISTRRVTNDPQTSTESKAQLNQKDVKHTKNGIKAESAVSNSKDVDFRQKAAKEFNKDFKNSNKPIIYGLSPHVNLLKKSSTDLGRSSEQSLMDRIKGKPEKTSVLIQNNITDAVWDGILTPSKYASDSAIKEKMHDSGRAIGFKQFLAQHETYNVAKMPGSQVPDAEELTLEISNLRKDNQSVAWRKTSKGGLEFQLIHMKKPVYFVVDDIIDNLKEVAEKKGAGTSITSSELRWLYRHKEMPEVQENLKFVSAYREVSHEDVFNRPEWDVYKPKNTYK
ncbi:hypothetical protein [Algicola sagamiensis]|uniref:hypothetical protein n=1 Tax=Algicola sagamiensis TaxID=163869 RepID=UPI0003A4D274|nr:hypothetical protein [Algicola sagamiensis]